MIELKELRLNDNRLVLRDNHVTTPILPKGYRELDREISVQGETIIEGALYAKSLEVANGPLTVRGAVFTQMELHVNTDASGTIEFCKSVGSAGAIMCQSRKTRVLFGADVNAKQVTLRNCYVAANIFADEIVLEDCVVLGGVFATKTLSLTNVVVGTFNSPSVKAGHVVNLLLPSAFSVEPVAALPGTVFRCLALADLGALMRGVPEKDRTGAIDMDPSREGQRTVLVDEAGNTSVLRSYSVVGRVLAADLVDTDKLQNHFLLAAGSLGSQVLRTYDLGTDVKGNPVVLTPASIAEFFFRILDGRVKAHPMDASFSIDEVVKAFGAPSDRPPASTQAYSGDETTRTGDDMAMEPPYIPEETQKDSKEPEAADGGQPISDDGDTDFYCGGCGARVPGDATKCPGCGAELEQEDDDGDEEGGAAATDHDDSPQGDDDGDFYCGGCGATVSEDATVCPKCGASLEDDEEG